MPAATFTNHKIMSITYTPMNLDEQVAHILETAGQMTLLDLQHFARREADAIKMFLGVDGKKTLIRPLSYDGHENTTFLGMYNPVEKKLADQIRPLLENEEFISKEVMYAELGFLLHTLYIWEHFREVYALSHFIPDDTTKHGVLLELAEKIEQKLTHPSPVHLV